MQTPHPRIAALLLLTCACTPDYRKPLEESVETPRTTGTPAASPAPAGAGIEHRLPPGWEARAPRPLRELDFLAPGGVECWLTVMGPGAGGIEANLDRWRGQLGLAPSTPEEVASLARRPFLEGEGTLVDLVSPDGLRRLLVLARFLPEGSFFLRMSGPTEAVERERAAFESLADSLRPGGG
jgi:hypothetical protein